MPPTAPSTVFLGRRVAPKACGPEPCHRRLRRCPPPSLRRSAAGTAAAPAATASAGMNASGRLTNRIERSSRMKRRWSRPRRSPARPARSKPRPSASPAAGSTLQSSWPASPRLKPSITRLLTIKCETQHAVAEEPTTSELNSSCATTCITSGAAAPRAATAAGRRGTVDRGGSPKTSRGVFIAPCRSAGCGAGIRAAPPGNRRGRNPATAPR